MNNSVHQHLHSPTKLTEFARTFEEEPDTIFGRFVNKIQNAYIQSYNTVNDLPGTSCTNQQQAKSVFYADANPSEAMAISGDNSNSSLISNKQPPTSLNLRTNSESHSSNSTNTTTEESVETNEKIDPLPIDANEGRTMVNVLKRISNIMASKNNNLRNYKDTELQRFWMPDSKAKECYDCAQKFSTFRRKHHCRLCGQIFCAKCCNQVVPGKIIMCSGDLKVCNYCSKIVLSYLKSSNITVDLHADLQALQQDLSNKLEIINGTSSATTTVMRSHNSRKASLGYQEERFASQQVHNLSFDDRKNILQQSNSLITLHDEMQRTLPQQNCGLHLIEFLNSNHKSSNKIQAIAILNALLAAGFLKPIVPDTEQTEFDENLHYKFVELARPNNDTSSPDTKLTDPISPQFNTVSTDPQPPTPIDASSSFHSTQDLEIENSIRCASTISKLLESYCDHEEQLLMQLLRSYQLDLGWAKVLEPLCCRAANHFKPEYCNNDLMDIRNYINFKKVPGGKRSECTIVGGIVFSKNVAHKDMATKVERPRILLLQCPIVYERIEGKFVTISTVLLQEKEYLRNVCARIMSFKPNVVLVHKNVAGIAQDMLRSHGLTLVLDVKLSVMERVARTLQCDILTSIESNITTPTLGLCDAFYIRNFNDGFGSYKTLMYFEKLTSPRGYTCLLRGGHDKELTKVKRVASLLVYARYNWRLEMSFLLDEFAQPLSPKPPIFDSKESSPKMGNVCMQGTRSTHEIETEDYEEAQLRSEATSIKSKRPAPERKSEDKVFASVAENVSDFTDPLRSSKLTEHAASPSDQTIISLAVETRYDNRFRNALSSTLLSVSPFLGFPLPYLETEQGRNCKLRQLFPAELYFSKLWSSNLQNLERQESGENIKNNTSYKISELEKQLLPPHPFLTLKITTPITNREIQTLLAEFRSFGGRFPKRKNMLKSKKQCESFQQPQKISEDHMFKDALNLENHQRLPVLFCSFFLNPKSSTSFCTPPMLLDMKFYGQHDIMLGQFLQRYCCVLSSICPSCKLPMLGHVRKYVHSMGCIQVFLIEDQKRTDPHRIYFSSWCSICSEVTPSVPLSEASKCLSFAKYLELRFHGHAYKRRSLDNGGPDDTNQLNKRCEHSLHRDYIHYFSYRGVGAKFQYTPVEVWELELPALVLNLKAPKPFNRFEVLEEFKNFSLRGHEVYTRIHERIADLASEDDCSPLVSNLKTALSKDQFIFKQKIEIVQTLLTETKANTYDINDALVMAKRALAESIELWGPRLHGMAMAQKQAAKQNQYIDTSTICSDELRPENSDVSPANNTDGIRPALQMDSGMTNSLTDCTNEDTDTPSSAHSVAEKKFSIDQLLTSTNNSDKKSIKKMLIYLLPSTGHVNLLQSPFSAQDHLTLPLGSFPILVRDNDLSSIIAYCLTSHEYQRMMSILNATTAQNNIGIDSTIAEGANPSPQPKRKLQENDNEDNISLHRTSSISSTTNAASNSTINSTINESEERGKSKAHNSHIEISFQDSGSQFICKVYFAREFDIMRANTLQPPKLDKSLYKKLEKSKMREELKISQNKSGNPEIELVRRPSDACFANKSSFAEQNKNQDEHGELIEECRNFLARSLCNSVQWEARGGKSGSRFCKTLDDRFVLKEMTKGDINIFENFAPNYFDYVNKCQQQKQPTLLAKIFGVFKVTIKKKDHLTEKALLVMENLFYDCDIKNKFDLKGSERNRLVDPTNQNGEIVLLDENLVQMSWSKPLYVLSHSKSVLKDAINRDSSFLEKNEVMDYSLLVGLDNSNSVLVLGIIDYIRTFTFDKKVESFVKQTGILGGMGKLPTVISPERYKQRFTDAMDRYFYTVPDRWEGLSKI